MRFGELSKTMPNMALKVLSKQLRELEADGIIRSGAGIISWPNVNHTIAFPKGMSESSMSLRCCRAKGMPMMVMARSAAKTRCTSAV